MLDKYFGFLKMDDEYIVVESLIDHAKIDREEILLLSKMVKETYEGNKDAVEDIYQRIRRINKDMTRAFDNVTDHIIQEKFDQQKQYDLLRLQNRNEVISNLIIATAKRVLIFNRLNTPFPEALKLPVKALALSLEDIHKTYTICLESYINNKGGLLQEMHKVEKQEQQIDHLRSECLQVLYELGNKDELKQGSLLCLQELIEHLEEISDSIEVASGSLKWLLLI